MAENHIDLSQLLQFYDLYVGCEKCCRKESKTTCTFVHLQHSCNKSILAAKHKTGPFKWSLISSPPLFPKPKLYGVCRFFDSSKGCPVHKSRCSFASCEVEASVWNFLKQTGLCHSTLLKLSAGRVLVSQQNRDVDHQSIKKRILQKFPGSFVQLCEMCFNSTPPKITRKGITSTCNSAHIWRPSLFRQNSGQYDKVRARPQSNGAQSWTRYFYCDYVGRGKPCRHGDHNCKFAHNEVEMDVWTAESTEGFDRSVLPSALSPQRKAAASPSQRFNCQACVQQFGSRGCFMNHCNTLQHSMRLNEFNGKTTEWKYRDPPPTSRRYKLCERPSTCVLGSRCVDAHSEDELREWHRRDKASQKNITTAGEQGLISYQDNLLREYRDSINEALIMSEAVPGVSVKCDQDLLVSSKQENEPLKWLFQIQSERPLVEVALLKQEQGAVFSLGEISSEVTTYSSGERFCKKDLNYEIPVSFQPINVGIYEQWLVLDFDTRPVLLQKLKVKVGNQLGAELELPANDRSPLQNRERWHQGNRVIISCLDRSEEQKELLEKYTPPQTIGMVLDATHTPLIPQNYKDHMHNFLYKEELAEDEIISRLNVLGTTNLSDTLENPQFGMKFLPKGQLFCSISVPYSLTPDTAEGLALRRSVQSALVAPASSTEPGSRVYEAIILRDTTSKGQMHLQLTEDCCTDLRLKDKESSEMEVQFRSNRLKFCEMHQAVDLLPDTERVLPDLEHHHSIVSKKEYPGLNSKQQAAMDLIVQDTDGDQCKTPLLIYGPFGTGKTLTLATAARELALQPQSKVLICTLTNSSADLYVKSHFHEHVNSNHPEARPLRIKSEEASLNSTDEITLNYCHLSQDKTLFCFPDKDTVDMYKVVITTTSMARHFHKLTLPPGYFTHILIDEASQMLECEALMPLGLAGPNTRVVLAGDHMQMGPKLFSVDDHQRSNHTLLNRLFHYYQQQKGDAALGRRIIFSENYRSTKEIVDFVSTHFYVGKTDVIKAVGNVPSHPSGQALKFHHVKGECILDTLSMSWYNQEEATNIVEIVQDLLDHWPAEWDVKDEKLICVLSEGCQVLLIRKFLRIKNYRHVTVENMANVQGKQFRAVVMTAIHTRDSLLSSDSPCLEFFNDACVLNTAMTRAQSQVIVVGDAAALCYFGKCSRVWKSYVHHCISKRSVHPQTLTDEWLAQEVRDFSRFIQDDKEDDSDSESSTSDIPDIEDPILKELLDETKDVHVDVTAEGFLDIIPSDQAEDKLNQVGFQRNREGSLMSTQLLMQTNASDQQPCTLIMERFDFGYAIPHKDPSIRIDIRGRKNIGCSFPGDCVQVEILNTDGRAEGKVVSVPNENLVNKVFVCTIDRYDNQVMTPINICITKICRSFRKEKPKHIAVHGHEDLKIKGFVKIDEETKQNRLFVVRVLKWRETFRYPLGVVVQVLPKVTTLKAGLQVLDVEYQLDRVLPESLEKDLSHLKNMITNFKNRNDYRDITTFTIDPACSLDLDDAISVRDLGNHYEIGVHIADVARFVTKDSCIDKYAQNNGTSFYPPGEEPIYMFPKDLSTNYFSLLPGSERNAISLMVEIEKNTNLIKSSRFQLTVIRSDRKLSYEETECIIQNLDGKSEGFETVEGCVAIAYHFSEVLRKARKQEDWCYKCPDDDVDIGKRRSHMMVEDLMVMYNHAVTVLLLDDERSVCFTPVRCQDKPRADRFRQLKEKFGPLIPLSSHFTCMSNQIDHIDSDREEDVMGPNRHCGFSGQRLFTGTEKTTYQVQAVKDPETFSILSTIMQSLELGLQNKDIHKIVDLLTTDDIHPQLQPLMCEFKRCICKARILRSNSTHLSKLGHFDLQLDSYTWASSPIRRYVDVIVQRLLHSVLRKTAVEYTQLEIDMTCISLSQKFDNQSNHERKARCLSLALELNNQKARKVAFVIDFAPKGKSVRLSFPLNKHSMPDRIEMMYRNLQLTAQPDYDELDHSVVMKWFRRVYSFTNEHIHDHLRQTGPDPFVTAVPTAQWHDMLSAVKEERWDSLLQTLQLLCSSSTEDLQKITNHWVSRDTSQRVGANPDSDHYVELSMKVKMGDVLDVQLGSDTHRGLLVPDVQMLIVHDKFEICLQHSKNSILCFSKYAVHPSKTKYNTYMEYQKIWKPLCEMESASNAVAENDSIIIEDVQLTWQFAKKEAHLCGFFQLPLDRKKQWAIECDLKYCFLCIRMRDTEHSNRGHSNSDHSTNNARGNIGLMEVPCVIWVAHGITTNVSEDDDESYVQIDFRINHNDTIPDKVFLKDTRFTVELIPKLLPDVRKEAAINSLTKANQLVKDIAIGNSTNSALFATRWKPDTFKIDPPSIGFPNLNPSQAKAVGDALVNAFTLIQGPPGTGKTVVGVHIVYWFFMQNQKVPQIQLKSDDVDGPRKKRCILYCGPSNKSVDVVAGQLLKVKTVLKPLRVYSEQMEMLEFPYPGSNLRLSRRSVREEKPNTKLRCITLHHLIRKPENPLSTEIVNYDARIGRGDELSEEEIEIYKSLLRKARNIELQRHDVILCTCTASSNPNFSKLDIQQIIIDECAMATEPEAFIPLVTHKPQQIVLLGDHKQLQPIVHGDLVGRLGMKKSLFERYMDKALMLDTQYRMHELICEFPSNEFYKGALKTGVKRKASVLLDQNACATPILFGHVQGREISLMVSTERGNENSMANIEEAEQSVRIASLLIQKAGVKTKDVAILTPYNAQVAQINETLDNRGLSDICVSTITKSQGSEWPYVILSMVRSCPKSDIDTHPTRAWLLKRLGFLMDPNQANVGITRAQEGLCILGNRELLWCSSLWQRLLTHYRQHVVDPASNIQVKQSTVKPKLKLKAPSRFPNRT